MERKEALIVLGIIIIAIVIGLSTPKFSGKSFKNYYPEYKFDVSEIKDGKELNVAVGDQVIIGNLIKPTDQTKINLVSVGKAYAVLNILYGKNEQDIKIDLEKSGIDVDSDGIADLEVRMADVPSAGRALIYMKSLA